MSLRFQTLGVFIVCAAVGLGSDNPAKSDETVAKKKHDTAARNEEFAGSRSLLNDPQDLENRDLFYGSGGEKRAPQGKLTFAKEDVSGTNPKFDVTDEAG